MVHYYVRSYGLVHYYATVFYATVILTVPSHGPCGNKTWICKETVQNCSGTVNIWNYEMAMQTKDEVFF